MPVLVDSSVWIDHLRAGDPALAALLGQGQVLGHVFVTGELALGTLRQRGIVLEALRGLPQAVVAHDHEVMRFIDGNALHGIGIGYVDAHLLASTRLTPNATIWTRDRRLTLAADRLRLGVRAL